MALDAATIQLTNKKIIYVLNSGGNPTASDTACLLAIQSAQSGRSVLLCDTTGQLEKKIKDESIKKTSDLPIVNIGNNINILKEANGISFFTSKDFDTSIKDLLGRFDQLFFYSSDKNAHTFLMALSEFAPVLVMISGLRRTKKST